MLDERHSASTGRKVSVLIAMFALLCGSAATAADYLVSGGGGQLAIGGGLPLPIQTVPQVTTAAPDPWGGNNFPPLLIPINGNPVIQGTTAMSSNQKLTLPAGVLLKPAVPTTLGVYAQNNSLYAVRTDLQYSWPASPAVLSTAGRPGAATTTFTDGLGVGLGSSIVYKAPPSGKFGGPARFRILPGASTGFIPGTPVTVFARVAAIPSAPPPCTHPALIPPFPGPGNPTCVSALLKANPNTLAAVGAQVGVTGATDPMGAPVPGVVIGKFGATPAGTVTFGTFTGGNAAGATNMATSAGFPFTVGQIQIKAPNALGAPETFTISGADNRTAGGAGTIQLVAGSLSDRVLSGPNANRGWISLTLSPSQAVPTMNEWARIITIGLMGLLTVGFFVARRRGESA
jgi:hypothetical protein